MSSSARPKSVSPAIDSAQALDLVRIAHTDNGPQNGPPLTARFLGLLHLAMHDAYFATCPCSDPLKTNSNFTADFMPYISITPMTPAGESADAKESVAGAAITVIKDFFKTPTKKDPSISLQTFQAIGGFIDTAIGTYQYLNLTNTSSRGYVFGTTIAKMILPELEIQASAPGVVAGAYVPNHFQPYWFDDDPSHPVRIKEIDPNNPANGTKAGSQSPRTPNC